MSSSPVFLTASEFVQQSTSGALTVEDLAKATLERVQKRDGDVAAWAYLDPELVLEQAKALDAVPKEKRGPLHGVTVGVKDVIYTKDQPTEHNSLLYKDSLVTIDAACVQALRASGALIMGKTTTTEFAASTVGGPAKNPYDSTRTPGGSSSGSGAACGDYQCQIALGTQTVGSTIRPGSFNNIFAMKPTWNAISREGLRMLAISLDTLGLYSRSVEDLELLLDVFQIHDDEIFEPKPISELRIAYVKTKMWTEIEPAGEAAFNKSIELLKAAGAEVIEIEIPELDDMFRYSLEIMWSEARSAFLADYITHDLGAEFKKHVENATGITRKRQLEMYDKSAAARTLFDSIASKYDAILTPSVPGEAPVGQASTGKAVFCGQWTNLQCPVVNVPGFSGPNGMPIGVSLVQGRYQDRKLLTVSKVVAEVFKGADEGKMRKLSA